jgi:hypothetical protein
MSLRLYATLYLIVLLTDAGNTYAQRMPFDSNETKQVQAGAMSMYMQELGQAIPVYQGTEWVSRAQKAKGYPFFGAPTPYPGIVSYKGLDYPGLQLQYDIYSGTLLVLPGDGLKLEIPRHKIDRFVLDSLEFIRPGSEPMPPGLSDSIFYRVVYRGPTEVLAWHRKSIRDRPGEEFSEVYEEKVFYYLWSGERFVDIASEKQLLSLKGSKNRALRKKLSDMRIRFKKDTEQALVTAAAFYDQPK